jgi:hypothetical protein
MPRTTAGMPQAGAAGDVTTCLSCLEPVINYVPNLDQLSRSACLRAALPSTSQSATPVKPERAVAMSITARSAKIF